VGESRRQERGANGLGSCSASRRADRVLKSLLDSLLHRRVQRALYCLPWTQDPFYLRRRSLTESTQYQSASFFLNLRG
jgi:hypothetical protein